jgi:hypothetical protein
MTEFRRVKPTFRFFPLSLLVATFGCRLLNPGTTPGTRTPVDRALPRPIADRRTGDGGVRETKKKVVAKEEPQMLVANDRTHCSVDPEQYRQTAVGDEVACVWSQPTGRPE